jgi:hypothetical protein
MFSKTRRVALTVSVGLISAGLLSGLVACTPSNAPHASTDASPTSSATPKVKPTFAAKGTANDNIAYFRFLVEEAISKEGLNANTKSLAQKLAASGFDAAGIQYSDNSTAAGMTPDSVSVATLMNGQCLIAQFGPSIKGITVMLLPVLKSGGCLLGRSLNHL